MVNALLGQRYLAEGILPTTNEINVLKHLDPEHVESAAQARGAREGTGTGGLLCALQAAARGRSRSAPAGDRGLGQPERAAAAPVAVGAFAAPRRPPLASGQAWWAAGARVCRLNACLATNQ